MHSNNPALIIFLIPNHACTAGFFNPYMVQGKPFTAAISRGLVSDMCAFVWLHPALCFHMTKMAALVQLGVVREDRGIYEVRYLPLCVQRAASPWLRCQILNVCKSNVIFKIFPFDNRHPYTLCFSIQLHYSWQPPTCKMDTLLITLGFSEFL